MQVISEDPILRPPKRHKRRLGPCNTSQNGKPAMSLSSIGTGKGDSDAQSKRQYDKKCNQCKKKETQIYEAVAVIAKNNITGVPVVEDDMTSVRSSQKKMG